MPSAQCCQYLLLHTIASASIYMWHQCKICGGRGGVDEFNHVCFLADPQIKLCAGGADSDGIFVRNWHVQRHEVNICDSSQCGGIETQPEYLFSRRRSGGG
jgi:hypothetical protein